MVNLPMVFSAIPVEGLWYLIITADVILNEMLQVHELSVKYKQLCESLSMILLIGDD